MKGSILLKFLLFAFLTMPGAGQAATVIDFDSLSTGDYDNGDVLFNDGTLVVSIATGSVGDPRNGGQIQSGGVGAPFSGNYLSSFGVDNNGRVDLAFSVPITGTVTLDANYLDSGTVDFRVVDLTTDPVTILHDETDGPNTKSISFTIGTPTTVLRFRDNTGNPVEIDNLSVTLVPVPAAVWLFGSALGLLGWMKRKAS